MAKNEWVYDNAYKNWFYLKSDGSYANQEWHSVGGKWYYFKKMGPTLAEVCEEIHT